MDHGDWESHLKEGVQEVGRDGQDGNNDEDYKQDFGPWWISSVHLIWNAWVPGQVGDGLRIQMKQGTQKQDQEHKWRQKAP